MSADDRGSVHDSNDDYLFCRKDASIQLSLQGRVVDDGDALGSASSSSEIPPTCNLIAAPVSLTEYVNGHCSFLDARWFAAMHQDGAKLDIIDATMSEGMILA